MEFTLGTLNKALEYVVTNTPSSDFKWTIQPPPNPWVIFGGHGRTIVIPIATAAQGITNVQVAHQLIEERTKRALPADALTLCTGPSECGTVRAAPNSSVNAYLMLTGDTPPGKYSGPVFFSTPEKSGPESVSVNVQVSSEKYVVFGVLALIAGIGLGWIITAWITSRIARLKSLELVVSVRTAITDLRTKWQPAGGAGDKISKRLTTLAASLEEGALDREGLLPPERPQIFPRDRSAELQKKLDEITRRLGIAALVYEKGWSVLITEPDTPRRNEALAKLEDAALNQPDQESAKTKVAEILAEYRRPTEDSRSFMDATRRQIGMISQEDIARAFNALNGLGWAIWAVLTLLGGFYLLILDKPGFGLWNDLFVCFFWGIGLPTAAGQLTPAAVTQTVRATTPKT